MAEHELIARLSKLLTLDSPPIGITFSSTLPDSPPAFNAPMPTPLEDGRTGRVPAGCVFWMKAVDRPFSTVAADHANCSVGSVTHGLLSPSEVAEREDISAIVESGWVGPDVLSQLPSVSPTPEAIVYQPLDGRELSVEPTVILIRVTGRALMVLSDALEDLSIQGKPQCHIVALATKGKITASVGCALSRARTGMPPAEMTVAFPADRLQEVVDKIGAATEVDTTVARYASQDAKRFAR
ncbi:DUF169 domain-containing protein [Ferrimicrobium sp.]|uniref:DUF169 domain-containing protein n=1 Tax=Ferrimicrobium sp. TaxID=2926050 RepID=UPI00263475A6|nr:DUF169 domain-containing protein [Ferrimicrobium sp.]